MKPAWLRTAPPAGAKFTALNEALHEYGLNTVCTGSRCPNLGDCWSRGAAAFMILGTVCTRNCRFCAVKKARKGEPPDPSEPFRIRELAEKLGLGYVALTSVDRDDLEDGGAEHFAQCIKAVKSPDIIVEALVPDFQGDEQSLGMIADAFPDILGHNIEVVRELQALARDRRAGYELSLEVLRKLRSISPACIKSSIMLGLGESEEMVLGAMDDLRDAGVEMLTLGQYLRPGAGHLEVREYVTPEKFAFYKEKAEEKGFISVVSGPLVRSSYMAHGYSQRLKRYRSIQS